MEDFEPEPATIQDIRIPERLNTVRHGDDEEVRFLLHDDGDENEADDLSDRIIVFGSSTMLDQLARSDTWLMDGTFKMAPSLFYQLYTIHAIG